MPYQAPRFIAPPIIEDKLQGPYTRLIQHYWEDDARSSWLYGYFVLARDRERNCGYAAYCWSDEFTVGDEFHEKTDIPLEELERWNQELDCIKYSRLERGWWAIPSTSGAYALDDSKMIFSYKGCAPKEMDELSALISRIIDTYSLDTPTKRKENLARSLSSYLSNSSIPFEPRLTIKGASITFPNSLVYLILEDGSPEVAECITLHQERLWHGVVRPYRMKRGKKLGGLKEDRSVPMIVALINQKPINSVELPTDLSQFFDSTERMVAIEFGESPPHDA